MVGACGWTDDFIDLLPDFHQTAYTAELFIKGNSYYQKLEEESKRQAEIEAKKKKI